MDLGLEQGEWKSRFYKYKLSFNTKDIPIRLHFQITCGFSVSSETPKLKWYFFRCPPPFHHREMSRINACCCYMKKLEIVTYQDGKNF